MFFYYSYVCVGAVFSYIITYLFYNLYKLQYLLIIKVYSLSGICYYILNSNKFDSSILKHCSFLVLMNCKLKLFHPRSIRVLLQN